MIWQRVVAYILLRWEMKPLTWKDVKARLWLYTRSNPNTGAPSKWLFLWAIPFIVLSSVGFSNLGWLDELWVKALPFLAPRPYGVLQKTAGRAVGQWWLLGVLAVQLVFNYLRRAAPRPGLSLADKTVQIVLDGSHHSRI
jgi:hypothetical protein